MSSSDLSFRPKARSRLAALALAGLSLGACTVQPLYGTSGPTELTDKGIVQTDFAALRGQIGVAIANNRTSQIFRNAMLFRLNGGRAPVSPAYEIRPVVTGMETVVSIQQGSGVPSASSYRMNASFQVVRLSDAAVIGTGTRFATVPFDRSTQLYASSRALVDAREQAGASLAQRVELAVAAIIRKDLRL